MVDERVEPLVDELVERDPAGDERLQIDPAFRERLIKALADGGLEAARELLAAFEAAKRKRKLAILIRSSGCYPLCGRGGQPLRLQEPRPPLL